MLTKRIQRLTIACSVVITGWVAPPPVKAQFARIQDFIKLFNSVTSYLI